jgi:hypothetical protein
MSGIPILRRSRRILTKADFRHVPKNRQTFFVILSAETQIGSATASACSIFFCSEHREQLARRLLSFLRMTQQTSRFSLIDCLKGEFMSLPFQGKSALVTGSSRGIGRAIAERLGADGAAVVINYARNKQPAQTVVNNILETGGKAIAIQADISKPAEVRRMFSEAENAMGRLDIVIANAGVHIEKPFIENSEADYDSIFDVNTKGVFFTLQEAARVRDGAALSSFRRAARKCISPICRFILEAKGPSSSLRVPCRSNSARAM